LMFDGAARASVLKTPYKSCGSEALLLFIHLYECLSITPTNSSKLFTLFAASRQTIFRI
jgi:hypothetical protein